MKHLKTLFVFMLTLLLGIGQMWATDYQLVTSTDDLVAGAHYVIGSASSGSAVFMATTTASTNIRATDEIAIANSKITATDAVLILELGGSTGAWTFLTQNYTSTNGYLTSAASGKNNHCKVVATAEDCSYFTISFSSNDAVITSTGRNERNILRYNSNNALFACYSSGQNPIYLYKEVSAEPTLSSITVATAPTTLTYTEGDFFDPTGLVINANYDNSTSTAVDYAAHSSEFSFSPSLKTALATTDTKVTITWGEQSVDQAITVNTAAACTSEITITKADDPANGTFTLDQTGKVCIDGGNATVNVTASPAEHYHLASVSSTVGTVGTISDNTCAVTDINADTEIGVTFAEDTKYQVTWNVNGNEDTKTNVYAGEKPVFPSTPSSCDATSTSFIGWATEAWSGKLENLTGKTVYTSASAMPAVDGAVTYYAVFAKAGAATTVTHTLTFSEKTTATTYAEHSDTDDKSATWSGWYNYSDATHIGLNKKDENHYLGSPLFASNVTSVKATIKNGSNSSRSAYLCSSNTTAKPSSGDLGSVSVPASSEQELTFTLEETAFKQFYVYVSDPLQFHEFIVTLEGTATYSDYMTTCCTQYNVNIAEGITNGSVSADLEEACEGATVTLTFTPDPAYHLSEWTLNGTAQDIAVNTFTMPAEAVTVSATFEHDACTDLAQPALDGEIALTWNSAVFTWNEVEHAEKYTLAIQGTEIDAEITEGLTYTANGLTASTDYHYVLTAVGDGVNYCDKALEGDFSTPAQPAAPTFSVAAGTYYEAKSVEISAAEGASAIYYTLDGEDPTEASTLYEGAIAISESKTLKAVAKYAVGLSAIGEAAYVINIPMTVAEAIELIDEDKSVTHSNSYVVGLITRVESYNEKYSSLTYWISDNGKTDALQVYSGKGLNSANFSGTSDLKAGDKVIVCGDLKWYSSGSKYEFDKNNYLTQRVEIAATPSSIAISGTPDVVKYAEGQTFDPTGLVVTATYNTGYQADVTANVEWSNDLENGKVVAAGTVRVTATFGEVVSEAYEVEVELAEQAPAFSPVAGTYTSAQNITLTAADGAAIYYTLDGEDPTDASTLYEAPIALSTRGTHTIKAIAIGTKGESQIVTAEYNLNLPYTPAELVAANLPEEGTADIILTIDNVITGVLNNKQGIFLDQKDATGNKDIEIYYKNHAVPSDDPEWIIDGHLAGTITGTWMYYSGGTVWELVPDEGFEWTDLTYTKPEAPISWSATEAVAYTVGKSYELPTLSNEKSLAVAYSATGVASVDASTGEITALSGAGDAVITATYTEDAYQGKAVSYTLHVYAPTALEVEGALNNTFNYGQEMNVSESLDDIAGLTAVATYGDDETSDVTTLATWTIDGYSTKTLNGATSLTIQASFSAINAVKVVDVTYNTAKINFTAEDENGLIMVSNGVYELSNNSDVQVGRELIVYVSSKNSNFSAALKVVKTGSEPEEDVTSEIFDGDHTVTMPAYGITLLGVYTEKPAAPISWGKDSETISLSGDAATLQTLTNEQTLAVTYSSDNTDVATISNEEGHEGEITIKAVGTTTISAEFAGNDTYKATTVSYELTVTCATLAALDTVYVTDITCAGATFNWDYDAIAHADGYYLEVALYDDPTNRKAQLGGLKKGELPCGVYNLEAGTRYVYKVRAFSNDEVNYCDNGWGEIYEGDFWTDPYYITGNFNDWAMTPMTADSFVFENLAKGTYEIKVSIDGTFDEGKVKGFADLTPDEMVAGLYSGTNDNIVFTLANEGKVVVTYNQREFKVVGEFEAQSVELAGNWDWDSHVPAEISDDRKSATAKKTFNKDEWVTFKMVVDSKWMGTSGDEDYKLTRDDNSVSGLYADGKNQYFQADKTGEYEFTWTFGTNAVTVKFPDHSYTVAWSLAAGPDETLGELERQLDLEGDPTDSYTLTMLKDVLQTGTFNVKVFEDDATTPIATTTLNIDEVAKYELSFQFYYFGAESTVEASATKKGIPTGVDETGDGQKAVKVMKDNTIYIIRGDKTYTITGQVVK